HEGLLFGEVNLEQFHSTAGGPPMSSAHNAKSHSLNQRARSVHLGEEDVANQDARASRQWRYETEDPWGETETFGARPSRLGIDMLTAPISGTGIRLGLSERMYAACARLAATLGNAASEVAEQDMELRYLHPREVFPREAETRGRPGGAQEEREVESTFRSRVTKLALERDKEVVGEVYRRADESDPDLLAQLPPASRVDEAEGLELYAADTYLSVASGSPFLKRRDNPLS
ncbi:hypothetical protein, partial [Terrabacter ginsenosidimutans]|uniref:hypothetical protein n=1 Tax=Terrabacter ginsenosidimutans TaxID=490575 RepID=UPI0031EDA20F